MTAFVETDFLIALVKDSDRLKNGQKKFSKSMRSSLPPFSYLELLPRAYSGRHRPNSV